MTRQVNRFLLVILFHCVVLSASAKVPQINVVYPRENAQIGAADSTFIFGSVTPGSHLLVNGEAIPVHKAGGFIAFLPIIPGSFNFEIAAIDEDDTARLVRHVNVPKPLESFGYDSLVITDKLGVFGDLVLADGDRLIVDFQGTPGCIAYFSIPGYIDSIPMAETPPRIQPYWGESVFGIGAVPESMKIKGHYTGFIDIGAEKLHDSSRIYYHLNPPRLACILNDLTSKPIAQIDFEALALLKCGESKTDSSGIFIKINPDSYPRTVEFTDSIQIMRVGPRKGYLSIFQPEGITALAVGREGDWIKLRLSQTQYGWVEMKSIRFLEQGMPPPISFLKAIRTHSSTDNLIIEFPLSNRHPFRIEEEDSGIISVYIYGVTSDTDWIRYDFAEKDLKLATWSQSEPDMYCFKLYFKHPIWGYEAFYEGNILKLQINKPPHPINRLSDKIIVIDPGHSPDPGAIGPTGLTESKANLYIALALERELSKRGAKVILTRKDMSELPLYERPKIAKANDADIFVSIHNNALPDGVNPFENNGTSTYYYHPHSIELAKAIQTEMLRELDLSDHGLYYGNLAVNRPTQYPAVLVECAFMMIPEQEALLKTKKFQKKIAKSIRKGIEKFLKDYYE